MMRRHVHGFQLPRQFLHHMLENAFTETLNIDRYLRNLRSHELERPPRKGVSGHLHSDYVIAFEQHQSIQGERAMRSMAK